MGINKILEQSGAAKRTLYHHFANKDALIRGVQQIMAALRAGQKHVQRNI